MVSGGFQRTPRGQDLVGRATTDAAGLAPGKQTLTEQLGPGPATAPAHSATAHQVAEHDRLNAVITVVARGPDGAVIARWRARGRWVGPLPARHHGTRSPLAWTWSDRAARDTRIHTRSDGTGGEPVERWATQLGAATVDIVASAVDGTTPDDEKSEVHPDPAVPAEPSAAVGPTGPDPFAGLDPEHQRIVAEFERELGLDPDLGAEDDTGHGRGARGGDPHGCTGADTVIGGTGPGGPHARADGDHEGSETRGAVEGSRLGSALGVEGGSEGGRFGGEGKPGDDGVRMAGAIQGGVIAVPLAIKGVVEILLIADAGDITGAGGQLFSQLGNRVAKMSAAALRGVVASESRVVVERELRATLEKVARTPRWQALTVEERTRAIRIAYYELQRKFFRGFAKAAKDAERTTTKAVRGAAGVRKIAAQESLDAARVGAEAAEVEPVAARLPLQSRVRGQGVPARAPPAEVQGEGPQVQAHRLPRLRAARDDAAERQEDGADRAHGEPTGGLRGGEQGSRLQADTRRLHVAPSGRRRPDDACTNGASRRCRPQRWRRQQPAPNRGYGL